MLGDELLHELVLDAVGVLVLVDQHVARSGAGSARAPRGSARRAATVCSSRSPKSSAFALGEHALVGRVELGRLLGLEIVRGLGRARGQPALVLPLVDAPAQPARIVLLRVLAVAAQRLLRGGERVVLVVDREAAREAEVAGVAPQDPHAGRVEGRDPDALRLGAEQLLDALAHLAGGLVGEGDGEDLLGRDAAGADQVRDAVHQHARLAASRRRRAPAAAPR